MAKVTGPLLSETAHGTIAGTLTFSLRKTGQQVRFQRKQKDKITPLRTLQRDRFILALEAWRFWDYGLLQFGFSLFGGKDVAVSSLPRSKRAPQVARFVSDFLGR